MTTFMSVCSGIEAASVAWTPLGWSALSVAEVDKFPSAVLAHHYPQVPNYGDITQFATWPDATPDVLVGGTPCQSFSVAGLRAGLADPRGNLALTYLAIVDRYRPRWVVWENVPGVLSADGGCAFGAFLGGLAELGYGFAYRVLDAQYFGLAQRRKRVFVVGHLGDWRRAAAVLFERESLSGHPPPRRQARQAAAPAARGGADDGGDDALIAATLGGEMGRNRGLGNANEDGLITPVAGTLGGSSQSGGFRTTDLDNTGAYIPEIVPQAMSAKWVKGSSGPAGDEVANLVVHSLRADGFDASEDGTGRGTPLVAEPFTLAIRGRLDSRDLESRQDGTANAIVTPNGGRDGIGIGAIAYGVHGEHSSAMTSDGIAEVAYRTERARALDTSGGYATNQGGTVALAFTTKDHGADAGELAPTLRAGGHTRSHANGGVMPAVAYGITDDETVLAECVPTMGTPSASGGGHPPAVAFDTYNQTATEDTTQTLCSRGDSPGGNAHLVPTVIEPLAFDTTQVTHPANYSHPEPGDPCHPLAASAHVPAVAFRTNQTGAQGPIHGEELTDPLTQDHPPAVAFEPRYYTRDNKTGGAPGDVAVLKADASKRGDSAPHVAYAIQGGATRENPECGPDGVGVREDDCAYTIEARSEVQAIGFADVADPLAANQAKTWTREGSRNFRMSNVATAPHGAGYRMQVRRLTPRECERLQGFPDDYTLIPYRNKPAADGPRYKALGNSMAVPVMAWIGRRIQLVEDLP